MPFSTPPTPPDRGDPSTFPSLADAYLTWLSETLVPEMNAALTLGIGQTLTTIGDAGVTDNSITPGFYAYGTADGSSGGPTGVTRGHFFHTRRSTGGGESQLMVVESSTNHIAGTVLARSRVTGAWSSWQEHYHSASTAILSAGSLGFAAGLGIGSSVTQATSKSTSVTLNKQSGIITMNNAALAAGASVSFQLLNSTMEAYDILEVNPYGFSGYRVEMASSGAGGGIIRVTNTTAGSLSEALQIKFGNRKGTIT